MYSILKSLSYLGIETGTIVSTRDWVYYLLATKPSECIYPSEKNAKHLRVTIIWSSHINTITNKAKNSLRFIRQNVQTQNKQLKEAAYRTYVRPQFEYCLTIWLPWQKHLTHRIEMVQRSAVRYVQNDYHYTMQVLQVYMLRDLKWSSLEQRRNQANLTMLHQIHNKQVNVDHIHLTTTRNNKFFPHSKTKHHINSFFPRAIRIWNKLPTERMPQLYLHLQVA